MKYIWDKIKLLGIALVVVFVIYGGGILIDNWKFNKEIRETKLSELEHLKLVFNVICLTNYPAEVCDLLPQTSPEQFDEIIETGLLD